MVPHILVGPDVRREDWSHRECSGFYPALRNVYLVGGLDACRLRHDGHLDFLHRYLNEHARLDP